MKLVLLIVAVLIAIGLVVVLIGSLLPRDHVAVVTARIGATPPALWEAITEVANYPSWRTGVKRVEHVASADGKPMWREHSSNGAILMAVDSAEPPHRLVTRIADRNLPFGGTWQYDIESKGADTSDVTITERGSVYNPFFRFMSRFVFGHTATIDAYLRSLNRKFGGNVTG